MIEWFLSLEPEVQAAYLSAVGSLGAIVVALMALWAQARSQRQQTRLALFEARLRVFQGAAEIAGGAMAVMVTLRNRAAATQALEQLQEANRRNGELINHQTRFLFGPEVLDCLVEVQAMAFVKVTHLATKAGYGTLSHEELNENLQQLAEVTARLEGMFARYLERERLLGLSWWDRLMLRQPDESKRDPLLRPSPPMNVPRAPGRSS